MSSSRCVCLGRVVCGVISRSRARALTNVEMWDLGGWVERALAQILVDVRAGEDILVRSCCRWREAVSECEPD